MKKLSKDDQSLDIFRALYKKNAPMLISYACRFVDQCVAEDIVQDVFVKIWQKRSFIFLKEGIHTYLYNSVRHGCLDYLKHKDVVSNYIEGVVHKLKIEELYYNDEPQFLFTEDDRMKSIYNEINKLPDKCREIFTMVYLEERKTAEIADLLNLSKRTVEAQLYKALKTLREVLLMLFILFS
ncbi:MAG: RNA polymerase sigma-70 factor [Tannerella sp.]|jgi:RNA polymerase sigma-70 factor (ECF subfamily)|nr:RNA polymerase sigma-70 factor [Tannerella sp.]